METTVEETDRPCRQRKLMELPHEIILKIIDEVILWDRATGHDQIRQNSAAYALSRASAYWKEEVEKRHRVLYIETSLFPGFARWSLHSDWLFMKDRFKPSNTPTTQPQLRDTEPSLPITRPKTQASSIELKRASNFQKSDSELNDASAISDTEMVGDPDCPGLSLAEYMSVSIPS